MEKKQKKKEKHMKKREERKNDEKNKKREIKDFQGFWLRTQDPLRFPGFVVIVVNISDEHIYDFQYCFQKCDFPH